MVAATSRRRWGGDASSGGLTAADDDSTTAPKVCDEEGSLQLAGSLLPHDAEGREAPRRTGTTWSALFHILTGGRAPARPPTRPRRASARATSVRAEAPSLPPLLLQR